MALWELLACVEGANEANSTEDTPPANAPTADEHRLAMEKFNAPH